MQLFERLLPWALLLLVGGLILLVLGSRWLIQDHQLANWPTTKGTLEASGLEEISLARLESRTRYNSPTPDNSYKTEQVWALTVKYRYAVGGTAYEGERPSSHLVFEPARASTSSPGEQLKTLHEYLKPGPMDVHYDPAAPERSYLVHVSNPSARSTLLYGLAALVVAVVYFAVRMFWKAT